MGDETMVLRGALLALVVLGAVVRAEGPPELSDEMWDRVKAFCRSDEPTCLMPFEQRAVIMSQLAYTPVEKPWSENYDDAFSCTISALSTMRVKAKKFLANNEEESVWYENVKVAHGQLERMMVVNATRDAVFVMIRPDHESKEWLDQKPRLLFGFRGTAIAADVAVDFMLAMNRYPVARLDAARQFVKDCISNRHGTYENSRLEFFGHSLGGWLAEGVGNDYNGSVTGTIQTGAPIIDRGEKTPKAFNPPAEGANPPVRFLREGDLVPMGVEFMGNGITITRKAVEHIETEFNKRLRKWGAIGRWIANKGRALMAKIKQHSLSHFAPWMDF